MTFAIHDQHAVMQRAYDLLKTRSYTWTPEGYALTSRGQERMNPNDDEVVQGSLHALLCKAAAQTGHNNRIVQELNHHFSQAGFGSIRQVDKTVRDHAELVKVMENTIPWDC